MSTIHNTQPPESQLKKKSNSICHHAVRSHGNVRAVDWTVKTDENPADFLTKVVGGGQKRKNLVQMYLYDIHDGW